MRLPNSRQHKTRGQECTLQCQLLSGTPVYNICFKYKYHPEALPLLVFIFCLFFIFFLYFNAFNLPIPDAVAAHSAPQSSLLFAPCFTILIGPQTDVTLRMGFTKADSTTVDSINLWIHHSFNRLVTQSLLSLPFLLYSSLCSCDHCARS